MNHRSQTVLDYGPPAARRWRVRWGLLATPVLLAAASLATAFYESIHEPFYGTAEARDVIVLRVLPLLLMAAWPIWATVAVFRLTRQHHYRPAQIVALLLLALPLALWSARETLRARRYFELDQARVAEWEREAAEEAARRATAG